MGATTETNMAKIKGAEHPLKIIFSSAFDYTIPSYQRPYAWTEDHAGTLFDNLYDFYREEQENSYFLGRIVLVLIKKESDLHDKAEVIDGQQRLATLTILLAAIASLLKDSRHFSQIEQYVWEPGNVFEKLDAKPRLALRERDREFFARTVQAFDFDGLASARTDTEAQENIQKNGACLLQRLEKAFHGDVQQLEDFCSFLVRRCYMVVVSTTSRHSAFRVFSVLNHSGLELNTSDLIKAKVIGDIDERNQDEYTQKWEDLEVLTKRKGLEELLGHLRTAYLKERTKSDLYTEFTEKVMQEIRRKAGGANLSEYLIDEVLVPYAEAFSIARGCDYAAGDEKEKKTGEKVNDLLGWLNRIDNSDWRPPALVFLKQKLKQNHNPEDVLWFFQKLERLAACLHLCGRNVNQRFQRYKPVIEELQNNPAGDGKIEAVELTGDEKQELQDVLNGDIYHMQARRRNYLLLRLDSFRSDKLAVYDTERMTVEHVLPQTVSAGSEWERFWPDAEEQRQWVHRLANLVVLTRIRNSKAQNYDFKTKKNAYFGGRKDVSSFGLTTQVLNTDTWTPEVVRQRQKKLLDDLAELWELK